MTILDFDKALKKQPCEILTLRIEMSEVASSLALSGFALASAAVKIFDDAGVDVSSLMLSGSVVVDDTNKYIYFTVIAGATGEDYTAAILSTWTKAGQTNQIVEKDLRIEVDEKGYPASSSSSSSSFSSSSSSSS